MKWEFLREEEFKDAIERSGGLCVLPLGCLEKHGQQCPVGNDSLKAKRITEEAAELEDVMIFPTGMWLGDLCGANTIEDPLSIGQAGYIVIKPETLLTVLEELCDEIARNGFRKILIINGHGGNSVMLQHFLRRQACKKRSYATMVTPLRAKVILSPNEFYNYMLEHRSEYTMLTDSDMEVLKGWADKGTWGGGHADFTETASVMGYYPELIALDRLDAENGNSTHLSDYLRDAGVSAVGEWVANYPNAMSGFPAYGVTQSIGQAMNTLCARELAKIFKMLKHDERCVEIAKNHWSMPRE